MALEGGPVCLQQVFYPTGAPKAGHNLGRRDGPLSAWGDICCGVMGFSPTSVSLIPSRGLNIKTLFNSPQRVFTLWGEEQSHEGSSGWALTYPKVDNIMS